MLSDFLLNLIVKNHRVSKLCSRIADFIFPKSTKTYRVLTGPGRNLKFRLNARDQTAVLFGTYEHTNVLFLLKHISERTIFWDIGAYIGYFTCIMSRRLVKGSVISVEPLPQNIALLRQHIQLNNLKNVIIVEKALSSSQGSASFLMPESSQEGRLVDNLESLQEKMISVSVTTIDTLVESGVPIPDILKIDAEGEEGRILKGARAVLERRRPSFLIEIHNLESARICWDILSCCLYQIKFLEGVFLRKAEKVENIEGRHIWAEPVK